MLARRNRSKSLAYGISLALLLALAIPFGGIAVANHAAGSTLEVSAETATLTPGTQHTLTARTFTDTTENLLVNSGVRIHFEVEGGPAGTVITDDGVSGRAYSTDVSRTAPDMACVINQGVGSTTSSCSVTFTSNSTGTNLVRAWIDHDQLSGAFDGDATEGRFAGGPTVSGKTYTTDCRDADPTGQRDPDCAETGLTADPGANAEPDITDVVEVTWQAAVGDRCIDAEPNSDTNASGTAHAIEAQVTDSAATPTDNDDTFDCAGTAVQGATARITVNNGPAVTINGTQATTATAPTGSNGRVIFNVQCVSPNCTFTNQQFTLTVVGASGGIGQAPGDIVTKTWAAPGVLATFDVTPNFDTNEVNQTHTLRCTAEDALESGIAGVNCDFQIQSGPNVARVFTTGQPAGWIGECFTDAAGTCTVSYTSTATGDDVITGFNDRNGNNTEQGGEENEDVTKRWVVAGAAPSQVRLDMGDAGPADADCAAEDLTAEANPLGQNHQICAQGRNAAGQVAAAPITFTIVSGPGFFTDTATSTVNRGATITVQAEDATNGRARPWLRSTQTGNTVVRGCLEGSTTICSQNGTKPWAAAATEARNIAVTPETATNEPGTNHQLTATVIDRFGNPVPNVTISWAVSGAGSFVSRETTTDANGTAFATITSGAEGTSTVSATITTANTQCAQPAGTPTDAPAGNCTDTATKTWAEEEEPPPPPPPEAKCKGVTATIVGTGGADTITGTSGRDVIVAKGGNDLVRGKGGNDLICLNGGRDNGAGGRGKDRIYGGRGNDLVKGGAGADRLFGNRGRDTLRGGKGNDLLNGGPGVDACFGGPGVDRLRNCE